MINKARFLLLLFVAFIATLQAQTNSKLDLQTFLRLSKGEIKNESQHLLVKGDVTRIKQLAEHYGGHFKYSVKDIASVEIPEKNLLAFSREYAVAQIENSTARGFTLMDTARVRNNIDSVHAGYLPLPHDLKGRDVIVGIIDDGIYWQHMDFRNADSSTRIRFIWDQTTPLQFSPNQPLPYLYGNQCSWLDLDVGSCGHIEQASDTSHGTCMAGIAAGNGNSLMNDTVLNGKYTGVAPESQLIVVRVDPNAPDFTTHMADAVDYIFKKADALGRPCVINTSLGTYAGSHDGKDLTSQLIDGLLEERNGRVLVAAAGNTGNVNYHLGYTLGGTDTLYTFFNRLSTPAIAKFDWWADTANFNQAQFAIGCNQSDGNNLGRTPYYNVPTDFNLSANGTFGFNYELYNNAALLGTIHLQATLIDVRYHIEVVISPTQPSLTHLWRLQTRGFGSFDLWSSEALTGSSEIVDTILGLTIQFPEYKHADHIKTLVSAWQCSDNVITVGNYSSQAGYIDIDSFYVDLVNTFPHPELIGSRYYTSSFGPTRDGRLKPDVMATGNTIICTGNPVEINTRIGNNNRSQVGLGGKHIPAGGTSMASAIVTGIAALYLEKRPTANYQEVKRQLICTAVKDSYTGPVANNEYGNGKVNAFAAVTRIGCFTFGAMDTSCLNYNPLANVDSGGCIAAVYGCMDPNADNYNPLANVSDGSCTYTGISNIFGNTVLVQVIPNPFSAQTNFKIEGLNFERGEIKIYNQLGAAIDAIKLNPGKTDYQYQNEKLPKGVYYYTLNADGRNVKAGKLVVE